MIDQNEHIYRFASSRQIEGTEAGTETFGNAEQSAALAAHWRRNA
jgi:hypothetical protein